MTAPPGALTWESAAQRNTQLKLWRRAVSAAFAEHARCIRIAWALDHLFNAKAGYAYASNSWLASETGIAENKVREALGLLERGSAIIRAHVNHNGRQQRVIYPARALIPRPAVGREGEPRQPGHHNLSRIRLPKSELERARLAARARERNAESEPAEPPHGHPSEGDRSEGEPTTEGEPAAPIPFTRARRHRA